MYKGALIVPTVGQEAIGQPRSVFPATQFEYRMHAEGGVCALLTILSVVVLPASKRSRLVSDISNYHTTSE